MKSKPGTARGYFAIGIEGGSKAVNLGNLLRSAHAFGASFVFTIGADPRVMDTIADTSRAPSDLPLYHWQNIEEMRLPRGCRLVGIELVDDAVELPAFAHPVHAAYVLGPERGVLSPALIARCAHLVRIPTALSLNVATAGAIVMYDRLRCLGRFASRPVAVGGAPEARAEHVRGAPRRRTRGFDALSWPREDQICMLPSAHDESGRGNAPSRSSCLDHHGLKLHVSLG